MAAAAHIHIDCGKELFQKIVLATFSFVEAQRSAVRPVRLQTGQRTDECLTRSTKTKAPHVDAVPRPFKMQNEQERESRLSSDLYRPKRQRMYLHKNALKATELL